MVLPDGKAADKRPHCAPCRSVYTRITRGRPQTPQVSRQFIQDTGRFEFGPLLAGKDRSGGSAAVVARHPDQTAKLRIINRALHARDPSCLQRAGQLRVQALLL